MFLSQAFTVSTVSCADRPTGKDSTVTWQSKDVCSEQLCWWGCNGAFPVHTVRNKAFYLCLENGFGNSH